jgi:hypothetical protein
VSNASGTMLQNNGRASTPLVTMQVLDDTRVQPRHYKYAIDIAASAMNQADPGTGFTQTCCELQSTHSRAKDCCGAALRLLACPLLLHVVGNAEYALVGGGPSAAAPPE